MSDGCHWPEGHVEKLYELFQQGLSATRISAELDRHFGAGQAGYSRNAVIGKIHRMGWVVGSATAPKGGRRDPDAPKRTYTRKVKKQPAGMSQWTEVTGRAASDATMEAIRGTRTGACKYPHGDPREEDFHFCGADAYEGSAYCPTHHKLCYRGLPPAKPGKGHALKDYFPLGKRAS